MIKVLTVGALAENCIILADEDSKEALVVDPGAEGDTIKQHLQDYTVKYILATHGHLDHTGQVGYLKQLYPQAEFLIHKGDLFLLNNEIFPFFKQMIGAVDCPQPDRYIKEGDTIPLGKFNLTVLETPGHTPGSVSFYDKNHKLILTGDTLFKGSIGRTDLPGGDINQMKQSLKRLLTLPEDTTVLSGHGEPTTIGEEKRTNPYIKELLW
ncbi:MAG: MBL fold metallo-hydrolase [Aquificae bacterium]|nr:MBL fold metallo-hydrolase [Aquificota bacterium]